jgi:integrase
MHVEGWIVGLRGKQLSESTIRSAYTILRAVLDTAVRDGALARNPAAAVKRPKVTSKEAAYLTPEQVRALLESAKASRYAPLFSLLVNTGLRRGEALALQWSDVDLEDSLLRVRGTLARVDGDLIVTSTKTAKSKRSIPVSEAPSDCCETSASNSSRTGSRRAHSGTRRPTCSRPRTASRATLAMLCGRSNRRQRSRA